MKILFVAPWIPAGVRPRSHTILELLAEEHEVRFLGLVHDAAEVALAGKLPVADPVLVANPRWARLARSARSLVAGQSLQTGYADPRGLRAALHSTLADWRPDAVHLNVFRTAHLVEACGDTPVVIDLDEFRSEYYAQLAATGPNPLWRGLGRVEQRRMRAREDDLVDRRVPIIVSAPGDDRPGTYVVRSPCDFPRRAAEPDGSPEVLFVGRLSYEANVVGLRWFLDECWPGIRAAVPDARLTIVGSEPPASIMARAGDGVTVHADVPDVEPYYARATVAIAPIFRGTGVQLKLIQALSAGVPTVTTPTVADRAGVRDGEHVRVAQTPAGWVAAVAEVLTTPALARHLADAGREWVVAHHGRAAVRAQLAVPYSTLSGPGSRPAPSSHTLT
ncbi:glycosyltransferase involved in cell wall biosynthesis [Asanoa ferruginea]|uniref:Glycosyltransferase involved in cell wall biosynthesis n=1 Tax=Asanoa ferruginea TaxID=53367 RepID=A0A3E0A1Z3_9ACTN|nr:glycosyltransferase [Asanoa ferruginea]REG00291.1 glycosyltransferase involved in cell wall biosynthesis [Asanoa ferruginea]GIF52134.1 glycosyl transferase family 1 [Asanoa ferruginea]